jgi:hypothetical protein
MPADKSVRFDDGQSLSGKESGKHYQRQPGSRPGPTWLDLALQIQRQLLAEEKILGGQNTPWPKAESNEPQSIQQ